MNLLKIWIVCLFLLTMSFPSILISRMDVETSVQKYSIQYAFPNLVFQNPVDLQASPDSTNRLFVVEQAGIIKTFINDPVILESSEFLNIESRVISGGERGLLGLAFHPDFGTNGFFYVYYTVIPDGNSRISRFSVDNANPQVADSASEQVLLTIKQPYENHNGGGLAFGPDGFLYISLGDGGGPSGDIENNGQNLKTLLGSILRLDVDNPTNGQMYGLPADNPYNKNTNGYREEIYAYGFRNPWRISFDPVTGTLWTGDVGQDLREEVDIVEPGKNYGWSLMEGSQCSEPGCIQEGFELPIHDYGRDKGGVVTGGYVYRGPGLPSLVGQYIYGDFISGRIWSLIIHNKTVNNTELLETSLSISSFGTDVNNELYILDYTGAIYKFTPEVNVSLMPTTAMTAQAGSGFISGFYEFSVFILVLTILRYHKRSKSLKLEW